MLGAAAATAACYSILGLISSMLRSTLQESRHNAAAALAAGDAAVITAGRRWQISCITCTIQKDANMQLHAGAQHRVNCSASRGCM
jgi:hypothetical protein